MTQPLLSAAGLRRSYDGAVVVHDFTAEVHPGEIVVLLGPNGCGKTTSVEMSLGLRRSDEGTTRIDGMDPVDQRSKVAEVVGVQLQGARIHPRVRLHEYFSYLAALYGDRERVDEVLGLLGVDAFMGKLFSKLSGGQQRRAVVAGALCGRPKLAVLDEPTSGVDAESRSMFWHGLRKLVEADDLGVLTTTHDLGEAARYADRVLVMREGALVASGSVDDLTSATPFEEIWVVETGAEERDDLAALGVVLERVGHETTIGVAEPTPRANGLKVLERRQPTLQDAYLHTICASENS